MNTRAPIYWHALAAQEVTRHLASDSVSGLTGHEAARRLAADGPNTITISTARSWFSRLLLQFHAPLVYILIAAGTLTLWLAQYTDAAVIFAVVLANAIIGFVQESKALKAIDALARAMPVQATVRRDGRRLRIDAPALVVGDIVLLEPGDKVPADLRLLDASDSPSARLRDLHIDESTLTGESTPVSKNPRPLDPQTILPERANMAFASSLVTRGTGEGIVVAIADATQLGNINRMITGADDLATPLIRKIASFSRILLWVILSFAALAFAIGLMRANPVAEMFKATVALAVGAVPEGLPAAVTIMLAVGVSRMADKKAIIRKLSAVEALGSTTVICSDKTGTLTQNQMTVRAAWVHADPSAPAGIEYAFTGNGYDPVGHVHVAGSSAPFIVNQHTALLQTLTCGALCSDASLRPDHEHWQAHGDPTEVALVVSAQKIRPVPADRPLRESLDTEFPRLDVIPFESDRQYMATLHQTAALPVSAPIIYVKGSVERILQMSDTAMDPGGRSILIDKDSVHRATEILALRGLRVLAFARRDAAPGALALSHSHLESGLQFLGLQGMLDPPRPEAVAAVAACQSAGILVKMITGDHAFTASSIAHLIGISGAGSPRISQGNNDHTLNVLTGAQMARIPDDQLPAIAQATPVFARMTPEQKLRLVKALQSSGNVVAMTGDGVNDAPALKQADIGVAMGLTGTEVAKDAADIILADDNFASIVAAVEEGRSVFDNLTKFIVWTLPTNCGEGAITLVAIIVGWPLPILPVHALYINLVTAILLGMPLIFEIREPGIMDRPPRAPDRPLLTFELFMRTGLVSLLLCISSMAIFQWELARGMTETSARTAAVSAIVVGEIFYLFSSRSLLRPAWAVPLFSNMWLWAGIATMAAVQTAFVYAPPINRLFHSSPLDLRAWAIVLLAGAVIFLVVEVEKAIRLASADKEKATLAI